MLSTVTHACPLRALISSWSARRRHESGVYVLLNRTRAKESATLASKCAARRVRPARPSNSVGRRSCHVLTRSDLDATKVPQSADPAPTAPRSGASEGAGNERETAIERVSVISAHLCASYR